MKKVGLIAVFGVVIIVLVSQLVSSDDNYKEKVLKERSELISFFQRSSSSPFEGMAKPDSLSFFEIDTKYRLFAKSQKIKERKLLAIQKTKNESDTYFKIARLSFELGGLVHTLCVYENEENPNDILLPFSDLSNGNETYETGRYLHLKKSALEKEEVELDFNMATNPYCAYNTEYSCPIPPKENSLQVQVLAGEKKYKK